MSPFRLSHTAIIVPASSPNAYAVARGLRAASIPVIALDHCSNAPLRHSRFCKFRLCPDAVQSELGFTEYLAELAGGLRAKPVVFPTQDLHQFLLCRNRPSLEDKVIFSFMDCDAALDCLDKRRMYPKAIASGLTVPETFFPSDPEELSRYACSLRRYPYIVKPAAKFELRDGSIQSNFLFYRKYETKALRCSDAGQLLRTFTDVWETGLSAVVQEEIGGPTTNLWAIDFYADRNSSITHHHTGRKIRQYPSDFGTCTLGRSEERRELVDLAGPLVRKLGFRGIGNIEFKERDGRLYFLEINPRAWQWLHLASASGVNLPAAAYADMTGERVAPASTRRRQPGLWLDLRRDTEHVRLLKRGAGASENLGLGRWLTSVARARVEAISSLSDPLPLMFLVARNLFTRLVRRRARAAPGGATGTRY